MCNIWRTPAHGGAEMRPGAYRALPRSLRYVNITGGEPFLRHDLPEIIAQIVETCPRAELVISTNGLLPQKVREMMPQILAVAPSRRCGVAVSVDGLQEMHDQVRGVKGAYGKARHTLEALKDLDVKGVRIAFTAVPENISHMRRVYELSRELGVEFTCAIAHCSPHYFMTAEGSFAIPPAELRAEIRPIAAAELRRLSPKRWARAYFLAGLMRFAERRGRMLPCRAGVDTLFITPEGDVYPCNVFSACMGNISRGPFEELWRSEEAQAARARLQGCRDGCWMICSARTSMRRHPLRVAGWILWHMLIGARV
jgi:MoaA/NifB/PqqE/SkfB family radical SAM enzyme